LIVNAVKPVTSELSNLAASDVASGSQFPAPHFTSSAPRPTNKT
jgi:hypothetical protein